MKILQETVLPRRVKAQTLPPIVGGGDCGACVLAGILDIDIMDAYKLATPPTAVIMSWEKDRAADPLDCANDRPWEPKSFTRGSMGKAFYHADLHELIDRYDTSTPIWTWGMAEKICFGIHPEDMSGPWFRRVQMAMDAGYYGVAMICMEGKGYYIKGSGYNTGDHWVAIVGTRVVVKKEYHRKHREILLSCSSTTTPDEEWVEAETFLRERGGFNVDFVRPKATVEND